MKIKRSFFERNTIKVAKEILGKYLCRKVGSKMICGMISEVEAYRGEDDLACHACHGRTKRTEIMYGKPGYAYIYLCYGMHWMLNIVTEKAGFPAAVLIRALEPASKRPDLDGLDRDTGQNFSQTKRVRSGLNHNYLGPGKLTKYIKIDGKLNGEDMTKSKKLWIEDRGIIVKKADIESSPRIGVSYAKHCASWPWNFKLID